MKLPREQECRMDRRIHRLESMAQLGWVLSMTNPRQMGCARVPFHEERQREGGQKHMMFVRAVKCLFLGDAYLPLTVS
jgi:hypothetical protein